METGVERQNSDKRDRDRWGQVGGGLGGRQGWMEGAEWSDSGGGW